MLVLSGILECCVNYVAAFPIPNVLCCVLHCQDKRGQPIRTPCLVRNELVVDF